ncbi:MAG: AraC family transcriptional regulator, partial [Rhodocyclaceae bacterium]|nr:AraC family transcriptional regulator [Rhodocyclaceae bacterium]
MADTGVLRVPEATGTPAAPAELAAIIERYCGVDGLVETCVPGLAFYRATSTGGPVCSMYAAVLAIYAQGAKRVSLGDEAYVCDNRHYLVTSVDLPVEAQVIAASPAAPLLCCVLHLDARKIAALLSEIGPQAGTPPALVRGIGVGRLTPDLADPVLRLARLAEAPADVAVLAPLVEREILYRLLCGELGARLRHIVGADGQGHRVARAIDWLKAHYAEPLAIDALADAVNMSKS